MKLREFVELFDKNDVKDLFKSLSLCMEYVRLAVKEKPIAMIQPTEKDGWCAFRRPDGLCELHDRGLKPTEGVLASCKMIEEDNVPTYETSVLRAVANEWVKVENFGDIMRVVFKFLHENERRKQIR